MYSITISLTVSLCHTADYNDYSLFSPNFYIPGNLGRSYCVTISTRDDSETEEIEELVLGVRFDGSAPAQLLGDQEVVVTILDDDERMSLCVIACCVCA